MYYSGGERAENCVGVVVHKSIMRSVVKKIAYNDRIIAIKLQVEPIYFYYTSVNANIGV
jgi:hypothetical protein